MHPTAKLVTELVRLYHCRSEYVQSSRPEDRYLSLQAGRVPIYVVEQLR